MENSVKTIYKSDRPTSHGGASYRRRRCLQIRRAATTAVEFAIVLPLVLLIVFSLMEISRAVTISDSAKTSVIAGSRQALVAETTNTNVQAEMERILDLFGVRSRQIVVTPAVINPTVQEVSIQITVPFDSSNGLYFGQLFDDSSFEFTTVIARR